MQNEELKRIAYDLEQSKINYQMIFRKAPVPYAILNFDQTIYEYNNAFYDLLIQVIKQKRQIDFTELLMAQYQDTFYLQIQELTNTKNTQTFEVALINSNDLFFDLYASIIKIDDEDKILITLNDITRRKLSERNLIDSQKKYKQLTENLNEVIVTFDENADITYIAESVVPLLNYSPNEIIGKSFNRLLFTDDIDVFYVKFHKALSGIKTVFDIRLKDKSNNPIKTRVSLNIVSKDGEQYQIQGLITNLSNE